MIRFFRTIRNSLIKQNRFKNYLLYATGEVLLVMIGIVLALQVNNWNNTRQEKSILHSHLQNVKKNIEFDQTNLREIIAKRDSIAWASTKLTDFVNGAPLELNELQSIYSDKNIIYVEFYFQSDQSGFESLKTSGYLNKLQGTVLEEKLFAYSYLLKKIAEQEKSMNDFLESIESSLVLDGTINNITREFYRINRADTDPKKIIERLRNLHNHPAMLSILWRGIVGTPYLNNFYLQLLEMGDNIIIEIDKFEKINL